MEEIMMWVFIGLFGAAILGILIYYIIKIFKSSPEQRKKLILDFLIELVKLAQDEIESDSSVEVIDKIEKLFKEKASWFLKIVLLVTQKANLKELIQEALDTVIALGESAKDDKEEE